MNLRANEAYQAVISEIEAVGGTYVLEMGSKHCLVKYQVGDHKGQTVVSYGSKVAYRTAKNARSDLRRDLRSAGVLPIKINDVDVTTQPVMENNTVSTALMLTESNLVPINGEPRMRDSDIAEALDYTRGTNIRNLIEANRAELSMYGHIAEGDWRSSEKGGRPTKGYFLNREQSLLVAMLSRTARAAEIRHQVIRAYSDYEARHTPQAEAPAIAHSERQEPELLANDAAIDLLVERFSRQVIGQPARQIDVPAIPDGIITRKDFEGVMSRYFQWMKSRFSEIEAKIPAGVTGAQIDRSVSDRIGQSHALLVKEMDTRSTQTATMVAESLAAVSKAFERLETAQTNLTKTLSERPIAAAEAEPAQPVESFEEEAEPKFTMPRTVPLEGSLGLNNPDLIAVSDIYTVAGLDPKGIERKRALSMRMRFSLEEYGRKHKIKPVLFSFSGQYRQQWPRDMVNAWYAESGRSLLVSHLRANAANVA